MSTPPLPGKGLSVKVDQELYDDLAVIMSAGKTGDTAGMTASTAVKHAVSLIAGTYRNAWAAGVYRRVSNRRSSPARSPRMTSV
ncbi:hypothetical protein [Streptomyces sp. NPDC051662]|uniref:hypothetical protein n=1 Tax=Streptomyces sp. NPDC051662 TaxID=3154750 RepID=UPI003443BCB1